ncbi:MAG: hypothetical protein U0L11_04050 [Acutalibacteraceae bacterium]|nr:hypothetical protein [Acutalibacteraceae bacterium]
MKTKIKAILPVVVICIISLAAEILLSNFVWLSYVAGNSEVKDYSPSWFTEKNISEADKSFAVDGLDFPINSVSYTVKANNPEEFNRYVTAAYYIADENSTKAAALAKREKISVGSNEHRITEYINSYGNATYLDVTFEDVKSDFTVSDLVINPSYNFSFNLLRFAAILIFIALIYVMKCKSFGSQAIKQMDFSWASTLAVMLCVTASLITVFFCLSEGRSIYYSYPLEGEIKTFSPYIQQFDAFIKGQLHIDVQPSAELLALENPYSPSERSGIEFMYDRAFFNGKYFSYFGIAPIIAVYLPFYLVSGIIPGDSIVMGIFSVITAIFLPLAVIEWAKLRGKNPPWIAVVCAVGTYFASMVLIVQRGRAAFYYIASIAAMAFLSAFLFFMLKAMKCDKKAKKSIFLFLAGAGFALAFLSRINTVLPVSFAIAGFIVIYAVKCLKNKKVSSFITEMAALGLPVAAAIIFSLWYNNARFGSPLQFGTDYQLTVANASEYKLFAGGIFSSVFHYFLQPFVSYEFFPYIGISLSRISDYGKAMYIDTNFGLFAVPFMLLLLLSPVLFKSKSISKSIKIILALSLVSLPVTAFANYCLGGVIFRYTADITLFAAFISAVILLEFYYVVREKHDDNIGHTVKKCIFGLTAITVVIVSAVSLSLNLNLADYDPDIYMAVKDFFVFWS